MKKFIGREKELSMLGNLALSPRPILAVIRGRRRIGKSRLAIEFAKNKRFFSFSGITPISNVTAQDQLDEFARQFCTQFNLLYMTFVDWSDAFAHLTQQLNDEPTVILMDEISWMGSADPKFIPKFKIWWDLYLQKFSNLTIILCGSVSTWIEDNIIKSTALFGRISLIIDLQPLTLIESVHFLRELGVRFSTYDLLRLLAITGGIPWYIEQTIPHMTIEENIKNLCFTKDGKFTSEYNLIFHDIFNKRSAIYKRIIQSLAEGMKTQVELRQDLNYAHGGVLGRYLNDLMISGFITKHQSWSLKTNKQAKVSLFRLSDPYLRFYIKYIEPSLTQIEKGFYVNVPTNKLPGWDSIIGIQIECLLLQNRPLLINALGLEGQDILADNPYIQKATKQEKGCQIDYLIQTRTSNFYVCEFKFQRQELQSYVLEQMQEKVKRLPFKKGYGICSVLFHISSTSQSLQDKNYFYRIINILDLIEP